LGASCWNGLLSIGDRIGWLAAREQRGAFNIDATGTGAQAVAVSLEKSLINSRFKFTTGYPEKLRNSQNHRLRVNCGERNLRRLSAFRPRGSGTSIIRFMIESAAPFGL